ncbi:hypothetical protein E8E14_001270 [Neopestalotiopsis sp. 37M]|nr:hypothetical protein E8E14_001270 [Neopestalotiopsis sp. 37M]
MWYPKIFVGLGLILAPFTNAGNVTENRALIIEFNDRLNAGNYDGLIDLFTSPNSTYWVSGSPARTCGGAGNQTVAARVAGYPSFLGAFDKFTFTINNMVAEDNLVMVEGLARGEGPGTFLYLQTTVWSFTILNGKIDYFREYVDQQEAQYLFSYLESYPQAPSCE